VIEVVELGRFSFQAGHVGGRQQSKRLTHPQPACAMDAKESSMMGIQRMEVVESFMVTVMMVVFEDEIT
jgi:hypothetical protein